MSEIPEKNLGLAIIRRAVNDALGKFRVNSTDGISIQRDAVFWLAATDRDEFSFEWWCEELDMEPFWVRRFVSEYKGGDIGIGNLSQAVFDEIYDIAGPAAPFSNRVMPKKYRYG